MEILQEYRHVINRETKDLLINCLRKVINKNDMTNFGFIGIVGSLKQEYSHDIDILIFPSENSKIGGSIISVANFYSKIEEEIKKHNERFYLSFTSRKILQEMTYYLSSLQEGGAGLIPVHSLFFTDLKSFKKLNPKDFLREIKKSLITLYGDFNVLKKLKKNISQKKLEPYFLILDFEMNSKLRTFPRHLIRTSAESLFHYLKSKYKIDCNIKRINNIREIEKELYRILKKLDEQNYSN